MYTGILYKKNNKKRKQKYGKKSHVVINQKIPTCYVMNTNDQVVP